MRDSNVDGIDTARHGWEWPIISNHQKHSERVALLRPIFYEMTAPVDDQSMQSSQGKALSVNISSGGMLLLMDQAPNIEQVLKVYVPTPITLTDTPTLAEVRWTRKVPFTRTKEAESYFVGLKFLF
jgi:c-di-GMP-binding flagellar brake protein YcgR